MRIKTAYIVLFGETACIGPINSSYTFGRTCKVR